MGELFVNILSCLALQLILQKECPGALVDASSSGRVYTEIHVFFYEKIKLTEQAIKLAYVHAPFGPRVFEWGYV